MEGELVKSCVVCGRVPMPRVVVVIEVVDVEVVVIIIGCTGDRRAENQGEACHSEK